jgi:hypothetical protein
MSKANHYFHVSLTRAQQCFVTIKKLNQADDIITKS